MSKTELKQLNPRRLLLIVIITVFLVEFGIMILLRTSGIFDSEWEDVIDAFLLVVILYPVLYILVFKSIRKEFEDRKKIEQLSLEQGQFLRTIIDTDPNLIFAKNREGKFTWVNKAVADMYGTTIDNLLGKTDADFNPAKEQAKSFVSDDLEVIKSGKMKIINEEPVTNSKTLKTRWFQTIKVPLQFDGKDVQVLGISTDITERREIEKERQAHTKDLESLTSALSSEKIALAETKAKDEAMLDNIADGVVAVSREGNIIFINQAAQKMLGWKAAEALAKKWYEVLLRKDEKGNIIPPEQGAIYSALTSKPANSVISSYYVRKDGTDFPVARAVAPIILNKKIIGAINVFRDFTREKEIDRAKSEFVSLASHQLRTPTTAINWFSKMLLNEEVGKFNEQQKHYLLQIYEGNKRMMELISALLDVSRIELGTFTVQPKTISLKEISKGILEELKPQITEKKLKLTVDFPARLPLVKADPRLTNIVFQNLLSNAINYSRPKGKIKLAISVEKKQNIGYYLITVSDTGIGIPENQQGKIFTKLFRAENAKDVITDGTGLGLFIVKSILENTGGSIWFESKENVGTTFHVKFPMSGMGQRSDNKIIL